MLYGGACKILICSTKNIYGEACVTIVSIMLMIRETLLKLIG